MSLAGISKQDVLAAMEEYDRLGREKVLLRERIRSRGRFVVLVSGRDYDLRALLNIAHRLATGSPLGARELKRNEILVATRATELGFDVADNEADARSQKLTTFGEIAGVPEGTRFVDRAEAATRGVHRNRQAGIVGNGREGAESIVVSGGYEDDEDYGNLIIYTGHGGRSDSGVQVADQSFAGTGNAALQASKILGTPVRVIRGSTKKGYSYDGLFRVEDYWREPGRSGFQICRFRMTKIPADDIVAVEPIAPKGDEKPVRRTTSVQRVVRKTAVADFVKQLHDHTCQMCGTRLEIRGRGYSEGAHIRALGRPHDGPDEAENVLCLCPNCHVRFDGGEVLIESDLSFVLGGEKKQLIRRPGHVVKVEHLDYHRARHS